MIRFVLISLLLCPLALTGCAASPGVGQTVQQQAAVRTSQERQRPSQQALISNSPGLITNRGQYIRPEYLQTQPTPVIPPLDACNSRIYEGLIGQHEGAIHIAGLPGNKRIIKPATEEDFERELIEGIDEEPPLLEVRDYIAGQLLYAPTITTFEDGLELGPEDDTRLTIRLDEFGYVQYIDCR